MPRSLTKTKCVSVEIHDDNVPRRSSLVITLDWEGCGFEFDVRIDKNMIYDQRPSREGPPCFDDVARP